jgi:hypothetical protein
VTWDDWVKILTLIGSIVLAYGSWQAQAWTKRQAEIHEDAVREASAAEAAMAVKPEAVAPAGKIAPPGAVGRWPRTSRDLHHFFRWVSHYDPRQCDRHLESRHLTASRRTQIAAGGGINALNNGGVALIPYRHTDLTLASDR